MVENKNESSGHELVVIFFKKYILPFVAIFILVLLFMTVRGLRDYKLLQEKINDNCGWGEEDYQCYCEKNDVQAIEELLNAQNYGLPSLNYTNLTKS